MCVCVFLWQYQTAINHIWKNVVKLYADTVLFADVRPVMLVIEQREKNNHDMIQHVYSGDRVHASTKDFLTLFSMNNKCVSIVC